MRAVVVALAVGLCVAVLTAWALTHFLRADSTSADVSAQLAAAREAQQAAERRSEEAGRAAEAAKAAQRAAEEAARTPVRAPPTWVEPHQKEPSVVGGGSSAATKVTIGDDCDARKAVILRSEELLWRVATDLKRASVEYDCRSDRAPTVEVSVGDGATQISLGGGYFDHSDPCVRAWMLYGARMCALTSGCAGWYNGGPSNGAAVEGAKANAFKSKCDDEAPKIIAGWAAGE